MAASTCWHKLLFGVALSLGLTSRGGSMAFQGRTSHPGAPPACLRARLWDIGIVLTVASSVLLIKWVLAAFAKYTYGREPLVCKAFQGVSYFLAILRSFCGRAHDSAACSRWCWRAGQQRKRTDRVVCMCTIWQSAVYMYRVV